MFGILLLHTLRTLFGTPGWWQKIIPGGVLNLLATLVLVLVITQQISPVVGVGLLVLTLGLLLVAWGYLYRIFVDALNGNETFVLPSWINWRAFALAGFWLLLICVGYSVIAVAALSMLVSVFGLMPSAPEEAGPLSLLLMFAFIFSYGFFPIVFTRFAAEGRVWAAFEPGPVWTDFRQVARGDYLQACLGLFGISLLGNLVLGAVPQIGLALASGFWFLIMVVFARVLGLLIRAGLTPKVPPQGHNEHRN